MNRKWRKRIIILAIVVAAVVLLRFTWLAPEPIEIDVHTLQTGVVEETVTNSKAGTVKVRQRAKLSPEMGGRVVYLGARKGERVEKGELLLQLEDAELRASLTLAERGVQAAKSNMQEACVSAQLAERELQRNKKLYEEGVVAESVLDQSENQRDATKARCEASRSEVKRAEASIQVAKANLERTELRAPFDGLVADVSTELGEWITPSPPGVPLPPVIDILDPSGVYVEAPIDETDAGKLRVGLPVRISLDPFPDQHFAGQLTQIAPYVSDIEGQNRTVDVEAEFENEEFAKSLLAGTSADIEVILDVQKDALRIPTQAILEGNRVLVVQGEHLVSKTIKTGLRNWQWAQVTEGLSKGDKIAMSLDNPEVKEDAYVKVGKEESL